MTDTPEILALDAVAGAEYTRKSLRGVLDARRAQLGFRLIMGCLTFGLFGCLIGWRPAGLWFILYLALQILEVLCFGTNRPWFPRLNRPGILAALTLLALINTVYGGIALYLTMHLGGWGVACGAYLIAGSTLNTVMMTMGSKEAFRVSILPYVFYAILVPLAALFIAGWPNELILLCVSLGGLQILLTATRLWKAADLAKTAELVAIARDMAAREANEKRLLQMAHQDALTGLANRLVLQERLAELVANATPGALLLIDLDGFKYVNDTLGHTAGDQVLREVAARIVLSARAVDIPIRLGGDEFALLLPGIGDPGLAAEIADRMIVAVSKPFFIESQLINVGASIGVVIYPLHGANAEQLLSNADLALYQAKAEGRHCCRFYKPSLRVAAYGKISQDTELRQAVERGEFELYYQAQIRLADGAIVGAEALLRWAHPSRGLLPPAAFLRALEYGPLAAIVGEWVLDTAVRQAAAWRSQGLPDFRISVNLFGAQFRAGNLIEKVLSTCAAANLPSSALEIEITENVILSQEDEIIGTLKKLRALGIGVAFDDYGTGYASLSLLKRYPISRLKIDQSFIQSICDSPSDATIVRAIISMAGAFDLTVIAEGVLTQAQADVLLRDGCTEAQGFLFGVPMSAAGFTASLHRKRQAIIDASSR